MKNLFIILILILVSCRSKKIEPKPHITKFEFGIDVNAKVLKIDSISNFYLVFIENEEIFFKIVSNKNHAKPYNGVKIKIGESYKFRIQQVTDRRPSGSNDQFTPINYLDITRCVNFKGTDVCTESSFELAKSSNLKGLYIIN